MGRVISGGRAFQEGGTARAKPAQLRGPGCSLRRSRRHCAWGRGMEEASEVRERESRARDPRMRAWALMWSEIGALRGFGVGEVTTESLISGSRTAMML